MFGHDTSDSAIARIAHHLLGAPGDLHKLLRRFGVPFVAQHAPVGIDTRGTKAIVKMTDAQTVRAQLPLPYPCNVVGFYCVAQPVTRGAFAVGLDDLEVALDVDETRKLTGVRNPAAANSSVLSYSPLGSIHILAPRIFMLRLDTSVTPNLGFSLRSAYATGSGSGLPGDVQVGIHAILSPLPERP